MPSASSSSTSDVAWKSHIGPLIVGLSDSPVLQQVDEVAPRSAANSGADRPEVGPAGAARSAAVEEHRSGRPASPERDDVVPVRGRRRPCDRRARGIGRARRPATTPSGLASLTVRPPRAGRVERVALLDQAAPLEQRDVGAVEALGRRVRSIATIQWSWAEKLPWNSQRIATEVAGEERAPARRRS